MSTIKFRMAAHCAPGGRPENEDNYQINDNLSKNNWIFSADKEIPLDKNGALIVVCDGMGGMNAGEVASQLAVDTIKQRFSNDKLSDMVSSSASIKKYIERVIIAADAAIKDESKADHEKAGMGSTIVLAWFVGSKVYVGWCGDSRAYRYNPVDGLVRLSHDHSYVQELVDSGNLKEELAFDHPNSNIITRSLGEPNRAAKPDVREFPLCNGDIILLCTDGICGMLRDSEIKNIMQHHSQTMSECRDALWNAARDAEWDDNVTIGLCQILSGAKNAKDRSADVKNSGIHKQLKNLIAVLIVVIFVLTGFIAYMFKSELSKWLSELRYRKQDQLYITIQLNDLFSKYENTNAISTKTWVQDSSNMESLCTKISVDTLQNKYKNKVKEVKKQVATNTYKFIQKYATVKDSVEYTTVYKLLFDDKISRDSAEIRLNKWIELSSKDPNTKDRGRNLPKIDDIKIITKDDDKKSITKISFNVIDTTCCSWDMYAIIHAYFKTNFPDYTINIEEKDIRVQNSDKFKIIKSSNPTKDNCRVVKQKNTVLVVLCYPIKVQE